MEQQQTRRLIWTIQDRLHEGNIRNVQVAVRVVTCAATAAALRSDGINFFALKNTHEDQKYRFPIAACEKK